LVLIAARNGRISASLADTRRKRTPAVMR